MSDWLEALCWLIGFAVLIAAGLHLMVLQFTYSLERATGQSRTAALRWTIRYHWTAK